MTGIQQRIWNELLSDKQFEGYKFKAKQQILNYDLDFYCSDLLLGIVIYVDNNRDQFLSSIGVEVMVITEQSLEDLESTKNTLLSIIDRQQKRINILSGGVFGV